MAGDYIPKPDSDFDAWQANYTEYLDDNQVTFGLTAADLAPVLAAQTQWRTWYARHVTAQASARAGAEAKDAARAAYVALIRRMAGIVRVAPDARVNDWEAMGLPLRDTTRTPAPPPTTHPLLRVATAERLRHVVKLADEATPTRRARPARTRGAELWVALADAHAPTPTDPAVFRFVSLVIGHSTAVEFAGPDAGKTAHYLARWVSTRGATGPWSETASATVGA